MLLSAVLLSAVLLSAVLLSAVLLSAVVELRPAWAEIDLAALAANTALIAKLVAPAQLCAVLKADAYGHGATALASTVLESGAKMLAVALVEEGIELREAGITAPILLLSEPASAAMEQVVSQALTATLYSKEALGALARAAGADRVKVHLKVDTGLHRVGASLEELDALGRCLLGQSQLQLEGLWTHLAVADEPDNAFTTTQLHALAEARELLAQRGLVPSMLHAANSAGAIAHPATRLDLVRSGIALYGYAPAPAVEPWLKRQLAPAEALRPVLSLRAQVHLARRLGAGEGLSYGLTYRLSRDSVIATVPIGYHDGVPRRYGESGGEVLIGGARRPIVGVVTMDQILIDCGPSSSVRAGDEVVLIGHQGAEEITAVEWAKRLGTIVHEVLCGIGERVPRRVVRGRSR